MNTLTVLLIGVLLRLVFPLGLTALIVILLRRMDVRWQREAEERRDLLLKDAEPCWKEQGLSMEQIGARAAAAGKPCWQLHRLSNGYLREACLDCDVFINAPAPAAAPTRAHI